MSQPLTSDATIVVVGASLAGMRAAEEIRHLGHTGEVVLIGDETHPPYDRPPLSKQFLAGKWDEERIHHHTPETLDAFGLEFRLGLRATRLDTDAHTLDCDDGSQVHYDGLIVATGARPRWLPGTEGMAGVRTLRTLDDSRGLRDDLTKLGEGARLVVIGAGFIGAEVAATCHGLGADVTVVEALPTPLAGVIGQQMGEVCAGLHLDAGVALRLGVGVDKVVPSPDGDGTPPLQVHLSDGSVLDADLVVVGIGVTPAVDWLEDSGLTLVNGVMCSDRLFAADSVVAAGDVARWTHVLLDEDIRIEHWTNAAEGGALAAHNLIAGSAAAEPYTPVPFFWSDQYQAKIQVLGRPDPEDEVVVVDGSGEDRKLVALYRRGDRLSAALAISRPRQLMAYRPLLAAAASFDEALELSRL
ncbi:MAG TPA: FAD-dependent oxidoreductase [Acidimicrobiales bacterium]|jgi:NADPH-dependent 2,4-dienoyl-CoA reductase/sulfur reductase-like enzyme|nr:FAD-dependent oxidoreductase [Acidimicrobiales bacterium]